MEGVLLEKRRKRKSRWKVYACCLEKSLMHVFINIVWYGVYTYRLIVNVDREYNNGSRRKHCHTALLLPFCSTMIL